MLLDTYKGQVCSSEVAAELLQREANLPSKPEPQDKLEGESGWIEWPPTPH